MAKIKNPLKDNHRIIPKARGGTYTAENTVNNLNPTDHMEIHGNLRLRQEQLERLKTMMDDRKQFMNLHNKCNNQLLAYKRKTDVPQKKTISFLEKQATQVKDRLSQQDAEILALLPWQVA